MKKILFLFSFILFFSVIIINPTPSNAEKVTYKWGKINYKSSYVGKITTTKDNTLYKLDTKTNKLTVVRTLKKGSEHPVYAVIKNSTHGTLFDLGNNQVVKKSNRLKYSTPTAHMKETVGKERVWLRNPALIRNTKGNYVFNIPNLQEAIILSSKKDEILDDHIEVKVKIGNAYYVLEYVDVNWKEKSYFTVNPFKTWNYSSQIWRLIKNESVKIGFNENQVWLALGYPDEINKYNAGTLEQWIYGDVLDGATYFYLENGILVDWQET